MISLLTGGAWIMYFNDAPTLVADLLAFEITGNQLFIFGLFTWTTDLLAEIARPTEAAEQRKARYVRLRTGWRPSRPSTMLKRFQGRDFDGSASTVNSGSAPGVSWTPGKRAKPAPICGTRPPAAFVSLFRWRWRGW